MPFESDREWSSQENSAPKSPVPLSEPAMPDAELSARDSIRGSTVRPSPDGLEPLESMLLFSLSLSRCKLEMFRLPTTRQLPSVSKFTDFCGETPQGNDQLFVACKEAGHYCKMTWRGPAGADLKLGGLTPHALSPRFRLS